MEKCFNCDRLISREEIAGFHIYDDSALCLKCAKELDAVIFDDKDDFPYAGNPPVNDADERT